MSKYLYVGSSAAVRSTWVGSHNTVHVRHMSFQYVGDSDDEAYGWAMKGAHRMFPTESGYAHHSVQISRMDPSVMQDMLDSLKVGK